MTYNVRETAFPPFFINQGFLGQMQLMSDSSSLSPATIDPHTGLPRNPDIAPGITGIAYVSRGEEIYISKEAENCGPDETERYNFNAIGTRTQIAEGTFAYYGGPIEGGTVSRGSGDWTYTYDSTIGREYLAYTRYESTGINSTSD